jgi:hypothetical protein
MDTKDTITLIGIIVSLIIGSAGLLISLHNSKKTIFINTVTSSRIKWIDTVRNTIAEYCGLSFQIFQSTTAEKLIKIDKMQQLRFLLKLQLNRSADVDSSIITSVDSIAVYIYDDNRVRIEAEINNLINSSQDLLKKEWERVKLESKKGDLPKKD